MFVLTVGKNGNEIKVRTENIARNRRITRNVRAILILDLLLYSPVFESR